METPYMNMEMTFEKRRELVLREARVAGIVDVSLSLCNENCPENEHNLKTIQYATSLIRNTAPSIYERLHALWGAK
jgi:hypothetical protein